MVVGRFVRPQVPEAKQITGRNIQCLKLFRRIASSKDQIHPRLCSLRNVQATLSQGRRIGKGYSFDDSLTLQHQE
jgi:hypothetical protein